MNIVTWKPRTQFRDIMSMQNRINRLFDYDFFEDTEEGTGTLSTWYPKSDIYETKDEYVFKLEVPGLSKDDVNVEFNGNTLSIKGERKEEKEMKKDDYRRIESCRGSFSRSFTLPDNIESKKINGTMKNGVLELRVAKAEEKKPKTIPISLN